MFPVANVLHENDLECFNISNEYACIHLLNQPVFGLCLCSSLVSLQSGTEISEVKSYLPLGKRFILSLSSEVVMVKSTALRQCLCIHFLADGYQRMSKGLLMKSTF